jgi:CxxC motif-containing protein (DUF1111 family)
MSSLRINRQAAGVIIFRTMLILVIGLTESIATSLPRERTDLSAADQIRVQQITQPANTFTQAEPYEAMAGGAATSRKKANRHAFSQASANLTFAEQQQFALGNALFRKLWVTSPASTHASDGLGPLFNARACQSCHLKDGRGHPPQNAQDDATSMLLRLALKPQQPGSGAPGHPDPVYGAQLQDQAIPGLAAEGRIQINYTERPISLADGTIVSLRQPHYQIADLAYGPLNKDTTLSPRIANQMIGLGLVEAIHPADLLARHDPNDQDQDGISGRLVLHHDPDTQAVLPGRFGWKAQQPTLRAQNAQAFAGDIGIATPDVNQPYGDCTQRQPACFTHATGVQPQLGDTEAPDPVLDLVTFYTQHLAVPARRDVNDPQVLRGKRLFYTSGCTRCHTPKFVTRRDAVNPAHAFQLIWPYSDFLLHDMGDGLADEQTTDQASGREWRTPPLWGIGLTQAVSQHTNFLHDGRARNLTEAILWHGGEAKASRNKFSQMNQTDRQALLSFLNSL